MNSKRVRFGSSLVGSRSWTTNAFYREYPKDIEIAKTKGCSVINMNTSHLYAACQILGIKCEYYAIVSDVMTGNWENDLTEAVDGDNKIITAQNTMIKRIMKMLMMKVA